MIKTTTRRTWLSAALVATVLAISGTPALAESPWRFQLTPDAWLVGSTGELRPVGTNLTVDFDESFTDILEDLDGAFFITGSVRKDRFVLLADFAWAALSRSGHVTVPTVGGCPPRVRSGSVSSTRRSRRTRSSTTSSGAPVRPSSRRPSAS